MFTCSCAFIAQNVLNSRFELFKVLLDEEQKAVIFSITACASGEGLEQQNSSTELSHRTE